MQRVLVSSITALCLVFFMAFAASAQQTGGEGEVPSGEQVQKYDSGWFCPVCGREHGRGMQQQPMVSGEPYHPMHRGMGMHRRAPMQPYSGMMPRARGQYHTQVPGEPYHYHGWSRGQYGPQARPQMETLDKQQARDLVEQYVSANPNLKVGKVSEKKNVFEAEVVTKDGSMVEKVLVDKSSGWMKRVYQ